MTATEGEIVTTLFLESDRNLIFLGASFKIFSGEWLPSLPLHGVLLHTLLPDRTTLLLISVQIQDS